MSATHLSAEDVALVLGVAKHRRWPAEHIANFLRSPSRAISTEDVERILLDASKRP